MTPTWDLRSLPTAKLLDLLHEYSQAHAHVSDSKSYEHPDSAHYSAHFYNMRWAVARELEKRGFKDQLLPLTVKSLSDLAFLRLDRPPVDLEYLLAKGLGPGERWITVHPHGDEEAGVPVLIKERPDGTAHIIGGAGGSLNYVKLTNLKSPEQYRAHAKQQAQAKRQAEKERQAGMSPEERDQERQQKAQIDEAKRDREDKQVAAVYKMMGLTPPQPRDAEQLAQENNISVPAAKIALARERQAHITAVKKLAQAVRETLIDDHEAAAEAGLGDISLKSASDHELWGTGKVSVDLLQPNKTSETAGIKTDFKGRATGAGASGESIKEESKLVRERSRSGQDAEQRQFSNRIADNLKEWNEQAKQLEATGQVKTNIMKIEQLPDPAKMLDILKADRALSQAGEDSRDQKQEAKRGVQVNPYVVDTSDDTDAAIAKTLSHEVEVQATRAMLSRVEGEEGLTKHVRNAAFDTLNQAALTLSGEELMGREVVDFLGAAGASQLLAQRLRQTLSDEDFDAVATAVAEMHGRDNAAHATEAMRNADEQLDLAKQLESGTAEEAMDVIAARTLNEQRMEHIANAREILGDTYGRLLAMGNLSLALKGATKAPKEIRCDMGSVPRDQAITMARSFGLDPEVNREEAEEAGVDVGKIGHEGEGDYRIDAGSGRTYITLKPAAISKVVRAFDPADTKAYEAAQKIKQGAEDEEGWLPAGIERRPASTFNAPDYEPGRFDTHLNLQAGMDGAEVREGLVDYIGARRGEGYPFDALRQEMHSEEFRQQFVPENHQEAFDQHLAEFFPKLDWSPGQSAKERVAGQQALDAQSEERARQFSEDYKRRRGMTDEDLISLHSQSLPIRQDPAKFAEAAHRTLSALPEAKVAFTPLGKLDHEGKETLRTFFGKEFGGGKPRSEQEEKLRAQQQAREAAKAQEPKPAASPAPETGSMFGDDEIDRGGGIKLDAAAEEKLKAAGTDVSTIQAENKQRVAAQQAAENGPPPAPTETRTPEQQAWDNYVTSMGGQQQAYETLQAIIRGKTVEQFAGHYGKVAGKPLKLGKEPLPNWEEHVHGQLPADKLKQVLGDRHAEAAKHMAEIASRSGGKFAKETEEGGRKAAYQNLQAMLKQDQGDLLMGSQFPAMDRPTLGNDAEKQLASVWGNASEPFTAKKGGVNLVSDLAMHGKTIKQQRAVKLALKNRRLGLHMGAGSGKSLVSLGAFTEMHDKGMAKKAVFAVPSAVQGQFGSEMLRYTTPGKYNWLSDPKATREDRFAAYADDHTHMVVVTHQAFRDDLYHAVAQHTGKTPKEVQKAFHGMKPEHRQQAVKAAVDGLGWKVDFTGVDEAHGIVNRQGKPDSASANAIDAFTHPKHMPNYLSMTGTPVKNDASEAFDTLAKLAPDRFTDRDSFMRKYGANTPTNWQSLQRLMGRYVYADRVSSGVERFTDQRNVKLHPEQQKEYSAVMGALTKVRRSRRTGTTDVEAMKVIAPDAFADQPEEAHQKIANNMAYTGLGGRLNARLLGVVNGADYEHNAKINAMREDLQKDKEKPHVIFAHHYKSVEHIQRLCGELGMKVGTITGRMSAADKMRVRQGFQPENGEEPKYDVLLNTDAGSTGQNLQRASILLNYDTPDTAMTHEQRAARIDRLGQRNDVTVRDYVTDTPVERRARKRLDKKYALSDVFQSPSEMLDDTGLAAEIQRVRADKRDQGQAVPRKMAVGESPEAAPMQPQPAKPKLTVVTNDKARRATPQEQQQQGPATPPIVPFKATGGATAVPDEHWRAVAAQARTLDVSNDPRVKASDDPNQRSKVENWIRAGAVHLFYDSQTGFGTETDIKNLAIAREQLGRQGYVMTGAPEVAAGAGTMRLKVAKKVAKSLWVRAG